MQTWNEYLDYLAVLISNLRMAYDMDIILGGDVGGVLSDYMIPLGEKVMAYNGFEHDVSYLKIVRIRKKRLLLEQRNTFLQNIWVNCKFFDPHIIL